MENTDVNEYISYFTGIIAAIKEEVVSNTSSSSNILSYLKHLPKRGINEGWPDTIYNLVDEGLKLLYKRVKY